MTSNSSFIVLASMLVLLSVVLEAQSLQHQYRHMRDISFDDSEDDSNDRSSNLRKEAQGRYNQNERKRRGFARWNVPQQEYPRFSRWQPSAYTISRPYFIPLYGPAGHIPVYFPPQPLNYNVGFPPDNPNLFIAPTYLPPKRTTVRPETTTTMVIKNRFPDFEDDDDPRPVWGESAQTQRPRVPTSRPGPQQNAARPQQRPARPQQYPIIPTRPPRPKTTTENPPLVHEINGGKIPLNAIEETKETISAVENIFGGPDDYTPAPGRPVKESKPLAGSSSVLRTTTVRPRTTTVPIRTTTKKENTGPSNCVWAVISCCSAASTNVAEACFEQRGCPGPFWDRSPCDSDFAKAAINKALQYYGQ